MKPRLLPKPATRRTTSSAAIEFLLVKGTAKLAGPRKEFGADAGPCGAEVTFRGVIRRGEGSGALRAIEYEANGAMAAAEFERIAAEVSVKWPGARGVVAHSVGTVRVGMPSLDVVIRSPHRREAFEATRFIVDELKKRLPIWKHFVWEEAPAPERPFPARTLIVPVVDWPTDAADFARRAAKAGANALEIRADALAALPGGCPPAKLLALLAKLRRGAPTLLLLLTPRAKEEGGALAWTQEQRRALIEAALPHVDAVDVELRSGALRDWAAGVVPFARKTLVLSCHDFHQLPPRSELESWRRAAARIPSAHLKIAARVNTLKDLLRLMTWFAKTRAAAPNISVLPMGPGSEAGRVAAVVLGSRIAFAALDGKTSAPGQIAATRFSRVLGAVQRRSVAGDPARVLKLASERLELTP